MQTTLEYFLWDRFLSVVFVLINVYIGLKLTCLANNLLVLGV